MLNTTTSSTISLAAPLAFHLGGDPPGFAVGDINLDGIPDIAVADGNAGSDVLIGNAGLTPHSYVVDNIGDANDGNYSAGNLTLSRPVVGITPTSDDGSEESLLRICVLIRRRSGRACPRCSRLVYSCSRRHPREAGCHDSGARATSGKSSSAPQPMQRAS